MMNRVMYNVMRKAKARARVRTWQSDNSERYKSNQKTWRSNNSALQAEKTKQWQSDNSANSSKQSQLPSKQLAENVGVDSSNLL